MTIKDIFDRVFNRWTKWEIYKSELPYLKTQTNLLTGEESKPVSVIVDIYEKTNKFTGIKKYKKVVKL